MKNKCLLLAAGVVLLLATSCKQYNKTKTGMPYRIEKTGSAPPIKQGDIVKLNISYTLPDTVLMSTFEHIPQYIAYDSNRVMKYFYTEIFPLLAPKYKFEFVLSVDSLVVNKMIPQYDRLFKKGGLVKGKGEILAVLANDSIVRLDQQQEMEKEKQRESNALKTAITKKSEKAQQTKSGAFVVIKQQGTGAMAEDGKQVAIYYRGCLLSGKEFDSNMGKDTTKLLKYTLGTHGLIEGMDEGLHYFAKGGKGTIYIPAMLGYGPQNMGTIPPYSNLVFDVEIVNITVPPTPKIVAPAVAHALQKKHGKKQ